MNASTHPTVTERRKVREAPGPHFKRVAKIWSAILGTTITPEQVILCMAGLKLAREAGAHEQDNIVDAQGYLSLLAEVREVVPSRSLPTLPPLPPLGGSVGSGAQEYAEDKFTVGPNGGQRV